MESKMQQQYDAWDDKINSLIPFMDDLDKLIEQHQVDLSDIQLSLKFMNVK